MNATIPMNAVPAQARGWLAWVLPSALLLLVILWQVDWGRAVHREPPEESTAKPQPVALTVLPEYRAPEGADATRETTERTLFNPTRRPAPTALAEAVKPKMQRGQFALSGTMQIDGNLTAFVREVQGGKSRRVRPGETLNGMTVAEIKPDRVRLTLGDESEDLILKVAAGPKTTIQPAAPVASRGPITATPVPGTPAAAAGPRDVSEVLAERRRLARAQELAAQGVPPGAPIPQPAATPAPVEAPGIPPPPRADMGTNDPRWQEVYQRYQMPRR